MGEYIKSFAINCGRRWRVCKMACVVLIKFKPLLYGAYLSTNTPVMTDTDMGTYECMLIVYVEQIDGVSEASDMC